MEASAAQRSDADDSALRLSKLLAYVLRHRPDHVGVELDPAGWVEIEPLAAGINAGQRLPFAVAPEAIVQVAAGVSARLFELEGARVRARSGHSVPGILVPGAEPPRFLFLALSAEDLEVCAHEGTLLSADPRGVLLQADETGIRDEELVVVEAGRAAKKGVEFEALGDGLHRVQSLPWRYVLSSRDRYERQVSAGGVLVRREGATAEFALIRTLPRAQTQGDGETPREPRSKAPDVQDARGSEERRRSDRRRQAGGPPQGVERRRGTSRRMRRRRRSGRWGPNGRLELPKGKLEPGETLEEAAVREVREELGLSGAVSIRAKLSKNHYAFRTPEGRSIFKTVHYYLLACGEDEPEFRPARAEGIVRVEWWSPERAISQVAFPNLKPVLEQAWAIVQEGTPKTDGP